MLFLALLIWGTLFLLTGKHLLQTGGRLARWLHANLGSGLWFVAAPCLGLACLLVIREHQALADQEGVIGVYFNLAMPLVAAATFSMGILLGAHRLEAKHKLDLTDPSAPWPGAQAAVREPETASHGRS